MIYLLGDVQGCDDALQRLLAELAFSPSRDRLVLLGDLVNRGPASLAVLRRVAAFGDAAISLLGNHDLHLLAVAHGARSLHKGDTFGDVLQASDAPAWIDWIRHQRLAHMEAGWLCVHAGVVPQWSATQVLSLAAEVQDLLRSADLANFLPRMYGNEPRQWSDTLTGDERRRFVINALTRLRFCTADGRLDFKTKEGAGAAPEGYLPWFAVPGRATQEQPIAFGHWSTLGLINETTLLATDTGCVWGGCLSAVRVDGGRREVVQVPCEQASRPGA
ncbi:MAG: symmetrical bis(5'-nucleosyl)-tetraphosphatase [Rubrivivax sp.]|nr:symmetrical bis(5'-nucleosyl)-tetraphosphatase [Rubrivivax sp.]